MVLAAECIDLLDSTVVNLATPTIRRDFGSGTTALQWISGGYALTFAVALVTGARMGDVYGRRRMFLIGSAGFTLASTLCAVSQNTDMLISFRLIQGLFAAAMIPQGIGILRSVFAPEETASAFAIFGPVIGGAAVLGPIVGGALVATGSWRWVFLINLPLGVLAFFGAARLVPEAPRSDRAGRIDLVGSGLISVAAVLLVYPLIQGRDLGWPWWSYLLIALSAPVLGVFAWWIRREARNGGDPIVTPSLFAKRGFDAGLLVVFTVFAGMIGVLFALGLYFQLGLHFSPLHAGLTFLPWAAGMTVGAGLSGAVLGPKFGRVTLQGGAAVMLIGAAWLLVTIHRDGLSLGSWDIAAPYAVWGIGTGLLVAPMFDIAVASVAEHETGSGSGVLNAVQQLASSVGVAIIGTVFFSAVSKDGFTAAAEHSLWVSVGLIVATLILTPLLPRYARESDAPTRDETAAPAALASRSIGYASASEGE